MMFENQGKKRCKYCGEWFEPYGDKDVGNIYCSTECRIEHGQGAIRMKYGEELNRRFARNQMESVKTGVLDQRLKECKRRGITYAEYQKMKTLEERGRIMEDVNNRYILEKKIDGEWWEWGRYANNTSGIESMVRAGAMLLESGFEDIRVRREGEAD